MRFEKLNDDKIRITLDLTDLKEKEIDYHSFMSNSFDAQKLFLDMLEEAEQQIGFETKDYKISIEAIASIDGNFIITVTRSLPDDNLKSRVIRAKRKIVSPEKSLALYRFDSFDYFCQFCQFLQSSKLQSISRLAKKEALYLYQGTYYLLIEDFKLENKDLKYFYSTVSEFGKFVNNTDLFKSKLLEYGKVIMKNNAIRTCHKHFSNF